MKELRQKTNKGSYRLPIEQCGKANYRHFARAVARSPDVDVKCSKNIVLVMHHDAVCPQWVIQVGMAHDLYPTLDEHGEAIFEYIP